MRVSRLRYAGFEGLDQALEMIGQALRNMSNTLLDFVSNEQESQRRAV